MGAKVPLWLNVKISNVLGELNMGSDVKGPNVHRIIYVTASDLHVINSKGVTAKREALLQGEVLTEVPGKGFYFPYPRSWTKVPLVLFLFCWL